MVSWPVHPTFPLITDCFLSGTPNISTVVEPLVKSAALVKLSCLQTTSASMSDHPSSQTVLHDPLMLTSTRPTPGDSPIILTPGTPVAEP